MGIYAPTPPGGSNTQLQYNNNGVFGGTSGATTSGSAVTLTAPIIDQFGTASGLGAAWTSYTPTFANTTLGNGSVSGGYLALGKAIFFTATFTLGTTSAVGSAATVSLPVTSVSLSTRTPVANVVYRDDSAATTYPGTALWSTTTTALLGVYSVSASPASYVATSSTIPFTWATLDTILVSGFYQAA